MACALWLSLAGAAAVLEWCVRFRAGCRHRWRVPLLQGGAVKVVCALYVGAGPLQGAGAGYCGLSAS